MSLPLKLSLGRRSGGPVTGLDIQPGLVAAVQVRVNGAVLAERAAALPLGEDVVREGEVVDVDALTKALQELFAGSKLDRRVRIGVANQRTVMRTLELPPVTDRKELAAAVRFQAQDQVPMPLSNAVLDFQPLGVVDTPAGPRQRVMLVAAQRDMIERLLAAVRGAGLRPEGIDLSAFALIRSLHHGDEDPAGRVLYLNVDGLTNMAIAEGTVCRFARMVGRGVEGMARDLAERRGITLAQARELLASVDLHVRDASDRSAAAAAGGAHDPEAQAPPTPLDGGSEQPSPESAGGERAGEAHGADGAQDAPAAVQAPAGSPESDVRKVLENGIREIAGEVRKSLDFHRSQEDGGEVSHVVLSGAALDLPGFGEALQESLGCDLRSETIGLADPGKAGKVSTHRLAVAAGLAVAEAPR